VSWRLDFRMTVLTLVVAGAVLLGAVLVAVAAWHRIRGSS
jgi:hypothetical protein